jgi:hypothetical protein
MFMMTDPATAIKWDVFQLVELQIETLRQEGRLSDSALIEYHARSEKITELYHESTERFENASTGDLPTHRSFLRFEGARPPFRA